MRQVVSLFLVVFVSASTSAQITVSGPAIYPSGPHTEVGIVGDFDGDGDPDVVVDNMFTVSFLPNTGAGALGSAVLSVGGAGNIARIAAGDMDGDGDLDLCGAQEGVGGAQGQSQIFVMLNNGDGTFASPSSIVTIPVGYWAYDLEVGQLSVGPSGPDVAQAVSNADQIRIYDGTGAGSISQAQILTQLDPQTLVIDDFDGDGDQDIAAVGGSNNGIVRVHINNGFGGFSAGPGYLTGTQGGGVRSVATSDLDGDGDLDLVVGRDNAGGNGYVGVLLNNGNGTFGSVPDFPVPDSAHDVATADLDGDGLPEILATDSSSLLAILPNLGGGVFGAALTFAVGGSPRDVAGRDMNGDGAPDIVVTTADNVAVFLNGTVQPAPPYAGSGEDLFLLTGVNGAIPSTGPGAFVKPVAPMDAVTVLINSPQGSFNAAPFVLAAEPFPTGTPPGPFPGFPEIHMSLGGMRILIDTTGLIVPIVIGSTGVTLTASIPPTLSGQSIMLQAAAVSNMAANGIFATTDGHEFVVQ